MYKEHSYSKFVYGINDDDLTQFSNSFQVNFPTPLSKVCARNIL